MISLTPSFFVVLLVVMENAAVPTDGKSDRILGGKKASITEFPSMAFLEHVKFNGYYSCGATIISDRWILTAGHCVEGVHASNVTLKVGSEEKGRGILRRASRIIMHEEYIHERDHGLVNIQNDIAVAEVEKPFPLNDFTIKAARLATQETDIPLGNFVTAVGWGSIGENKPTNILQKVNLEIMNIEQCKKYYPPTIPIDRRVICTPPRLNGKGTCKGDSGGPLFSDGVVVGITSFGGNRCVPDKYPSVYTKVAFFRDWIRQKTGIRKRM